MTIHRISIELVKPCWEGNDFMKVAARFQVTHPRCRGSFSLTFSPEGAEHRKVYQGPLVSELFGDMSPEGFIIAAEPIHDPRPVITVAIEDVIELGEYGSFTVAEPSRVNPDRPVLVPVPVSVPDHVEEALARRGDLLEDLDGDDLLELAYELLDEIERLRATDQLGRLTVEMFQFDPDHWTNHFPLPMVAAIQAITASA